MMTRQQAVQNLLQYNAPIDELASQLRAFTWDSDETLGILSRQHVIVVLERYLQRKLTAEQLEAWANAIEGRDDIEFEPEYEESLQEAVHFLANPLLVVPITPDNVRKLLATLS